MKEIHYTVVLRGRKGIQTASTGTWKPRVRYGSKQHVQSPGRPEQFDPSAQLLKAPDAEHVHVDGTPQVVLVNTTLMHMSLM